MINSTKMRQDLIDTHLKIYYDGCNAALVDIARIHMANDEELVDIAKQKGIDISKWDEQSSS